MAFLDALGAYADYRQATSRTAELEAEGQALRQELEELEKQFRMQAKRRGLAFSAGMSTFIDLETIRDSVAIQNLVQLDRPGSQPVLISHINGDGFSDMTFETQALSPQEFSQWLASTQAQGPALDEAAYRGLLRQSSKIEPYTYRTVAPNLFQAIVSQQLPPGEGPRIAQADADTVASLED